MARLTEREVARTIRAHLDAALRSGRYEASGALEALTRELSREASNPEGFRKIVGLADLVQR